MPKTLRLVPHHPTEELAHLYRQEHDPVARSHLQILWLVSQRRRTREIAAMTGYSARWIQELARRYNTRGVAGLHDGRHTNPGGTPLLSAAQQQELDTALDGRPPDGGLWSGRKVAAWIAAETGRSVSPQRGWEYLRRLGRTPQVPRPAHALAEADAREGFEQTSPSS
jgi:transposase